MSKTYDIIESSGKYSNYTLTRNGERVVFGDGVPNNAELQFWMERESYRKALKAALGVLWMAEKYADGGRVECDDYDAAMKDMQDALNECGLTTKDVQR